MPRTSQTQRVIQAKLEMLYAQRSALDASIRPLEDLLRELRLDPKTKPAKKSKKAGADTPTLPGVGGVTN